MPDAIAFICNNVATVVNLLQFEMDTKSFSINFDFFGFSHFSTSYWGGRKHQTGKIALCGIIGHLPAPPGPLPKKGTN